MLTQFIFDRNINFWFCDFFFHPKQGANLRNCCLERADMSKCNLEGAILINCHMVCANLENSNLRATKMDSGHMNEITNMEGANLNVRLFFIFF